MSDKKRELTEGELKKAAGGVGDATDHARPSDGGDASHLDSGGGGSDASDHAPGGTDMAGNDRRGDAAGSDRAAGDAARD